MGAGPISVTASANPTVSIKFDPQDASISQMKYAAGKPLSSLATLQAMQSGPADSAVPRINVEVRLRDDGAAAASLASRLIRYWYLRSLPGATVDELGQWRIVGMDGPARTPFTCADGESPPQLYFIHDRPRSHDAHGFLEASEQQEPFGQLQEFIAGDEAAGGVYYQIYTLRDAQKTRLIATNERVFPAREYREILQVINGGRRTRSFGARLYFMAGDPMGDATPAEED